MRKCRKLINDWPQLKRLTNKAAFETSLFTKWGAATADVNVLRGVIDTRVYFLEDKTIVVQMRYDRVGGLKVYCTKS